MHETRLKCLGTPKVRRFDGKQAPDLQLRIIDWRAEGFPVDVINLCLSNGLLALSAKEQGVSCLEEKK
jgi:hypothetical protein